MKLATFVAPSGGGDRLGAVRADGALVDLQAVEMRLEGGASGRFASMLALIKAGPAALESARALLDRSGGTDVFAADAVRLRAPLPVPAQMRDFMTFEKHLQQAMETSAKLQAAAAGRTDLEAAMAEARAAGALTIPDVWYQQPVYYKANRFAVSGPEDDIVWPAYSQLMDYECELACVIGTGGKDIPKERALEHVFGFTIFNDFSARDAQAAEMRGFLGPAKGKDFDNANAMGPYLVTLDEIGDPQALTMVVRVNGEERSRGSSASMHWSFADLIAWVSRGETLHPAEVLGSGTVGDGCGLEHGVFLQSGDVVELEIETIGVLRNTVRTPS